ncbi:MAG TPA: KH domain-containing protein [Candidatus Nanoarchaeia archaeon]|nr:KH domain-containing protein [Candidatus Nanoarchaeia archaeon]
MFANEILIPKDRVAVLVGTKGAMKRRIQKEAHVILDISREGDVLISSDDNLDVFIATNIVKAIGRGFNPEIALNLVKDNFAVEFINIKEFTRDTKKDLERVKARLIGTKGKAWQTIENLTGCKLAVYGKTVAIIGDVEDILLAKEAVVKLLSGSVHGNVYGYVERTRKKNRN